MERHTTTMRNHTLPPHLFNPLFLNQPLNSMKRAADLKRADALKVLRLEEQSHFRLCRLLPFPLCPLQRFRVLRLRRHLRQRRVSQYRRIVNMRFDQLARCLDAGARQRRMAQRGLEECLPFGREARC